MLCCTCAAAVKLPLPAWLASIVHVPTAFMLTVEPDSEHTDALAASTAKLTVRPEEAVAVTV